MITNGTMHPFECKRDELTIRGTEYLPIMNDETKVKALIISHGFGANATHFEYFGEKLASLGYAVYTFDFCGGYTPGEGKSDGNTLDMSVESEVKDLKVVLEYVSSLPYIDNKSISLLGSSQGGLVSAIVAARTTTIDKLILICPALSIPDNAREGCLAGTKFDTTNFPETLQCLSMTISRKYFDAVVHMDTFKEIAPFQGEVLIIHGMKDSMVDYKYSVKAHEVYGDEKCRLHLMEEADHGFKEHEIPELLSEIQSFLNIGSVYM